MERGYSVSVEFASKELTKAELVKMKDTTNCERLDEATKNGEVVITPDYYAILNVHNEKANGNKDYRQYVIVDKNGISYLTGSSNMFDSFQDIATEMGDDEYSITVYRKPSKNFKGKDFLTCSIC